MMVGFSFEWGFRFDSVLCVCQFFFRFVFCFGPFRISPCISFRGGSVLCLFRCVCNGVSIFFLMDRLLSRFDFRLGRVSASFQCFGSVRFSFRVGVCFGSYFSSGWFFCFDPFFFCDSMFVRVRFCVGTPARF